MARNDPADNGGLFIGRRPGTAPLRYRTTPQRAGTRRQRIDGVLAAVVLVVLALVALSCWGPQPLGWLWVGSRVNYWTGSVFAGIVVAFFGLLASVMATLWVAHRLDALWRILRRAAGHEQRDGVLVRIFAGTAVVAGLAFLVWFVVLAGPAPSMAPQ